MVQSPLAPFTRGRIRFDSGVFLYTGWKMSEGYLPYLDSWDNKGPVLYLINMLGIKLNYYYGLWLIEVLFLFVSAIFMYKTFRFFASKIVSIISVIYVLVTIAGLLRGGNFTEEFALPFSCIAIYIFTKYIFNSYNFNNYQSVFLGSTFAATMLLRPNIATIWPAFCIVYFLNMLYKRKYANAIRFSAFFLLGVSFVALPVMCYLSQNSLLHLFLESVFVNPMSFEKPSLIIRLAAISNLLFILNIPSGMLISSAICWFLSTFVIFRKDSASEGEKLLYISLVVAFLINIYANSLSGYTFYHYAISFIPILALPSMFTIKWFITRLKTRNPDRTNSLTTILISLFLIVLTLPSFKLQLIQLQDAFDNHNPIAEYILFHTKDNDKIQIFSDQTELYYKTKRQAASKYSYTMSNGVFDDNFERLMVETIFRDIEEKQPAIVITSSAYSKYIDGLNLPVDNRLSYESFLREHYVLDEMIDDHYIYLKKNP